jgi:hypothetical protein
LKIAVYPLKRMCFKNVLACLFLPLQTAIF